MVPRYSYGQCSIGAASGTVLDVLRTQKLKENEGFYGFTDFRGLRRRGGGADTQQRIKLPPARHSKTRPQRLESRMVEL